MSITASIEVLVCNTGEDWVDVIARPSGNKVRVEWDGETTGYLTEQEIELVNSSPLITFYVRQAINENVK